MKLTFIGHAGFLIEDENILIVMDPWLSKKGAYDSTWMQFPCNHHLDELVLDKVKEKKHVFVYISHEHKDHFDIEFLTKLVRLRPEITLLIPDFKSKSFISELKCLNLLHIRELKNDEHFTAGEFNIYLFIDESGINHDSAILVKGLGHSFLNLNDCKIFDRLEYIKNKYGPIDVFTAQFSGASWHPICYEMSKPEYVTISIKKKLSKYHALLNAIKILKPNRYIPSAGPPALLDPMHYEINFQDYNIFPKQFNILKYLKSFDLTCNLDNIMPGDVYCFKTNNYTSLAPERISEDNFQHTIEVYAQKSKYLYDENEKYTPSNLQELFQEYFRYIRSKTDVFLIKEKIEQHIFFGINEIKGQYIHVDLNEQMCKISHSIPRDNFYFTSYPAWQIRKLLEKKIQGEDLALTFRGKMKRSPDIYNTWIGCFINTEKDYLIEHIKLLEEIKNNKEKIEIECNGRKYCINRFCPHQGADLKYGWAEGNKWVCPKHRWRYDLENGGICDSANVSIDAIELTER